MMLSMQPSVTIFKREFGQFFRSPRAFIFLFVFASLSSGAAFLVGDLLERGQADLTPFFNWHPWLFLLVLPALSMGLWSDERRTGTIETLLTLPVATLTWVLAKFFAAWLFAGLALVFTLPLAATLYYLGDPDTGVVIAGYLGSWWLAGAYLAIGSCMSALSRHQLSAFMLTATVCLLFCLSGLPLVFLFDVGQWPKPIMFVFQQLSFVDHFQSITRGVFVLSDFLFFASVMVVWLTATTWIVDMKKASA